MLVHPVVLNKKDTCLTYALKRTNTKTTLSCSHDLDRGAHLVPLIDKEYSLYVGAVVVWETPNDCTMLATGIMNVGGNPALMYNPVFTKYHFGVVERIDKECNPWLVTISDCVRNRNNNSVPEIRLRLLNLRTDDNNRETEMRFPDYILHTLKLEEI